MKVRNTTPILRATVALVLALVFLGTRSEAQTYRYDDLGRLTRIDYPDGTSLDYVYDANGNRTSLTANAAPPGGGGSSSSSGCFIATAAYGSMLDPHVQSLRDFRDEHMLTNAPGRYLIRLYERTSPPIAGVIADHEGLRFMTRVLLTPIVLAAAFPRVALVLVVLGLIWRVQRRRKRASLLPA